MRDKDSLELGLQADRMSEAEVALRLAEFILSLPNSGAMASVAIDGASIKLSDAIVFDIGRFMAWTGWEQIREPQFGRSARTGAYRRNDKTIRVHSRPSEGDVVATIGGRRTIARCRKGPLVPKPGSQEHALLTAALGQALLFEVSADNIVVAAVPDTPAFRWLAEAWRERPLVKMASIRIALVAHDSTVAAWNSSADLEEASSVKLMSWMAPSTSVRRARIGMLKNRRGATHHV